MTVDDSAPAPCSPQSVAALVDHLDWSATPLGSRAGWPASLRAVVDLLLAHSLPMIVLWGEHLTQIYNDGYAEILGPRHPQALGQATRETWPEVWHINEPLYAGVRGGETYAFEDQLYPITRHGYLEEAYFTLTYSPVRDESGGVAGVLVTVVETTGRVQATRTIHAQAQQLTEQNADLLARTRALDAFAELTTELSVLQDPYALVQRAQEVTLSLLGSGYGLYYEQDGDHWRNRVQTGDVGDADLQAFIDAGPRVGHTPSVDVPWTTRQPYYQDVYAKGSDTPPAMVQHVKATASLPVLHRGDVVGVFIAVLFEERDWTRTDRVVLDTVTRSLELALERAEQTRQLEGRAALDAFVALTEAVGSEPDPQRVAERAMEVLRAFLPALTVGYYALEDGSWRPRIVSGDSSLLLDAMLASGLPLEPTPGASLNERRAVFIDSWQAGTDASHHAGVSGAAALYPYPDANAPRHLLVIGTPQPRAWTSRERAMFLAVGRSLGLTLTRISRAEQVRLEGLKVKNEELEAANEELGAFSYSVSHDLMTPVRHISGFAQLAQRTLDDPVKTGRALTVIRAAAERMNTLIEAMLQLSRTGQQDLQVSAVDLGALVARARLDAADDLEGRRVEWQVQPLPTVQGDHATLQQVVTNLIENAVKYTRQREVTVIRVWAQETDHAWTMLVQDNGAGFDPRYAHKLFGIFQRLHRDDEFEGTGVGLANVRRIVARHGGTVHAEGALDVGATFSFTLPKRA